MLSCPHCNATALRRTSRTLGERLLRRAAAYRCSSCGRRQVARAVKQCWRCGTDLDRRKRQTVGDRVAALLALWPYSCRRCGARRYRWGKRSG
ncbi:MAG TPA: hypothetical protein VMV31_07490 [Terriglobales bacterium]|nr:hypothetical protein [Terriglobales bacterium]